MESNLFLRKILRKWKVVVTIAIICCIIGILMVQLKIIIPTYESSTKLYILRSQKEPINYDDIMVSKQLAIDYKELLKSEVVINPVLKEMGVEDYYTIERFNKKISFKSVEASNIMVLVVEDSSPENALMYANKISKKLVEKVKEITNENNLIIIEEAKLPTEPKTAIKIIVPVLSFIFGFFITLLIIVIEKNINNKITVTEEIKYRYSLKIIGIIPEVKND